MLGLMDAAGVASLFAWESVAAGVLAGLSMGLTGGGGAIFAVPMLASCVGGGPRAAVGVSLLTVAITAIVGVVERLRYGHVEIRTGLLLAVAGMLTAPAGTWLGAMIPGPALLVAFAILMLGIAHLMWHKAGVPANHWASTFQALRYTARELAADALDDPAAIWRAPKAKG